MLVCTIQSVTQKTTASAFLVMKSWCRFLRSISNLTKSQRANLNCCQFDMSWTINIDTTRRQISLGPVSSSAMEHFHEIFWWFLIENHFGKQPFLRSSAYELSIPTFTFLLLIPYLASIMYDTEVSFVFQLFWLLKFGVSALFLNNFFHKAFVCCFWEPALFIQQGQYTRRPSLKEGKHQNIINYTTTTIINTFRWLEEKKKDI